MTTLIVGASLAGLRTAEELRTRGYTDAITLIGDELHPPYDRPPLSKSLLTAESQGALALRSDDELAALEIDLVLGERAEALDPIGRVVRTCSGRDFTYDSLVIATGSRARRADWHVPGVFTLRTLDDARAIAAAASSAESTVVVGGGFIACEAAATFVGTIPNVSLVTRGTSLLTRALGAQLGGRISARLAAAGIQMRTLAEVDSVVGSSEVEGVRLRDGDLLAADLVVAGLGAIPNDDWLERSGLVVGDGVHCDEHCRALGADGVYAVGDVARIHHPRYGRQLRIEHWTHAQESAAVAAANIVGHRDRLDTVPYLWSSMLGAFIQVFGVLEPSDDVVVVLDDLEQDRWLAIAGAEGRLTAVAASNAIREVRPYRALLADGADFADAIALTR